MTKQKLFIGISGKMGTGKSTISSLLNKALPNSEIGKMAAPIYAAQDMLYEAYGLTMEGEKDRDLLIAIGQWGTSRDSNFWLEQFAKKSSESEFDIIICDDVRFENEADFFTKHGILIRIDGDQRGPNIDTSRAEHVTEVSLDNYDFKHRVSNTLAPEDMCLEIGKMMVGDSEVA